MPLWTRCMTGLCCDTRCSRTRSMQMRVAAGEGIGQMPCVHEVTVAGCRVGRIAKAQPFGLRMPRRCFYAGAGSGKVKPRPGVLRLMDEARGEGLKLAVCSAATKSSVIFVVEQLLGADRYRVRRTLPVFSLAMWTSDGVCRISRLILNTISGLDVTAASSANIVEFPLQSGQRCMLHRHLICHMR